MKTIAGFFTFGSKLLSSTFQAHLIGSEGRQDIAEEKHLIRANFTGIDFPAVFKQEYGKKLTDILDTGWPFLYLISNKLKGILEETNLTGWKTFPIRLLDKKKNEILGYHGLSITGRCGPIDYNKCEIIEKPVVSGGPVEKHYKGVYFGLDEWDGSDFFLAEQCDQVYISDRAAAALREQKLSNIVMKNLAEIEAAEFIVQFALKKKNRA